MPDSPENTPVPVRPITSIPRPRTVAAPGPRRAVTAARPDLPSAAPARPAAAPTPIAPVAPGVGRGATLSAFEMDNLRRGSSRAHRRMIVRRWIFLGVTAGLMALAFAAGYAWKKSAAKGSAPAAAAPVPDDRRREALALMDQAVRAKHEERFDDVVNLVAQARQADPGVHGGDIVLAEVALRRSDPDMVRRSAREALNRGDNIADANLLLALDRWQGRALPGGSTGASGDAALLLLADATSAEFSNGTVWFFQGDLLRELGRSAEAQRSLLGGLHRQQPWTSAAVIAAKLQLAGSEAGNVPTSTPAGDAMVALRQTLRAGEDSQPALDNLRAVVAESQGAELLQDTAFDVDEPPEALNRARAAKPAAIPYGGIAPPDMARRAKSYGY